MKSNPRTGSEGNRGGNWNPSTSGSFEETGGRMNKTKFNIQDQFLNQVRKDQTPVNMVMVNGTSFRGLIRGFDSFCVVIEGDSQSLVYKHAIASISPAEQGKEIKIGVHE
jgi:host factor-I protein